MPSDGPSFEEVRKALYDAALSPEYRGRLLDQLEDCVCVEEFLEAYRGPELFPEIEAPDTELEMATRRFNEIMERERLSPFTTTEE